MGRALSTVSSSVRVWGLGFRGLGLRSRVQGLGFRGSGIRVCFLDV